MISQEQMAVVDAPLRGTTMVVARAGAGKTTSLVQKAQKHAALDNAVGLYVAFAKAAQTDAEARFGRSAVCKTGHALAFPRFGRKYAHKLRSMRPFEVIKTTGLVDDYGEAKVLVDAIHDWCTSDAMTFPSRISLGEFRHRISPVRAAQLSTFAKTLWDEMCVPESPVPMPHDGYLKLFQLTRPRLPGDYLMVDEFQDTNPVLLDIIRHQNQPRILVGDPHQSIFAFRGAIDALDKVKNDRELFINQSFRFGQDVADVANTLLGTLKQEKHKIVGCGPDTQVRWEDSTPQNVRSLTIISRTNAGVFSYAVDALLSGQTLSFVGGVLSYGLGKLCDVRHLHNGNLDFMKDPFLRSFKSYWQLSEYAEEIEDLELLRLIRMTEEYGDRIFELVDQIHDRAKADLKSQVVLTTAHRCKGLTCDHVMLADDFPDFIEDDEVVENLDAQEVNLAYVAVTRAVHSLTLNSTIKAFLRWARKA